MRDTPECLNKRYQALDDLVRDIRSTNGEGSSDSGNDIGIKLLCEFWNILKENPDFNLSQAVLERMRLSEASIERSHSQRVSCFMAERQDEGDEGKQDVSNLVKKLCCNDPEIEPNPRTCPSKCFSPPNKTDDLPLSKVLCSLKEAASFDKKCNARINDLMRTQKELKEQIQHLEQREREGLELLQQADCMWSSMEEMYKKKVADSSQRQKGLMKQLKEIESSITKWRKNKKDIESQLDSIIKCRQEVKEKNLQKTSDIKCINIEIQGFTRRIENSEKEVEVIKKSLDTKKEASDAKIATLAEEFSKQQKKLAEELKNKENKTNEGSFYIKEARTDLQNICKVLLQKKLENEDLTAERDALNVEIRFLTETCDKCKIKCKNKQESLNDEIEAIGKEIAEFKVKCVRCHQCTDTTDIRKLCTDCPKCLLERDCLYEDDHCSTDRTMDCVCMSVKQKFLDNIFDNMYTVLERQTNTKPGKNVAQAVLKCLEHSRNGKLDGETRNILQDFILTTVKKNLNLTIIGGAVKTRCELDPETYKQLMTCLKQVKVASPPKEDKGTAAKKESCRRWGGTSECNCPRGPKDCVCTKKAQSPPKEPKPCPDRVKKDAAEVMSCPHRESIACGPDCAMKAVPSRVDTDVTTSRPDPCKETSIPFSKNMRAAQCVLGPEPLRSMPRGFMTTVPFVPDFSNFTDQFMCECGSSPTKLCLSQDERFHPRERIIEEVIGRYVEISPIDKVSCSVISNNSVNAK